MRAVMMPVLHDEKGFDVFLQGTGKVPLFHILKQMVELQWNHPVEKLRNCRGYSIGSSSSQKMNGLIVRNSEMVNRR